MLLISLKTSEIQFPELREMYDSIKNNDVTKYLSNSAHFFDPVTGQANEKGKILLENSRAIDESIKNKIHSLLINSQYSDVQYFTADGGISFNFKGPVKIVDSFSTKPFSDYFNEHQIVDFDNMINLFPTFKQNLKKASDELKNKLSTYPDVSEDQKQEIVDKFLIDYYQENSSVINNDYYQENSSVINNIYNKFVSLFD